METALRSGVSISHYRILGRLGSGGMGEVYKAHDTSLDRGIALKVLPSELVKNEDRVRRFIQEARSASSLSHPNIVTIHEIGQAEVDSDDGEETTSSVYYIAMELIDGETLRKKLEQKLPLKTLLGYLAQAAEGLAKAHAAGIVHRDLKPENVMISRDGFTKVLDFGLAKLSERKSVIPGESDAPTAVKEKTREGVILGTVGYMSPEQVMSRPLDHRSDIFSFGCILYEAATGRKPFAADSEIETMHKILHDKPPAIDTLNSTVPAELRRMIRRCLAKEPDKRYQSMKDLAMELADLVEEYDELSIESNTRGSDSSVSAARLFVAPRKPVNVWLISGVTLLIGIAGIIFGVMQMRMAASNRQASSFQSMRLSRLTTTGNVTTATISPDGRYVAHAIEDGGKFSLWVRHVATTSDVQIVPPISSPFRGITFSPDGNYIYYIQAEVAGPGYSYLFQIPVLGGTPRKLLFDIDTAVSFSPDGSQIAFIRGFPNVGEGALMIARADGTGERRLAARRSPDIFPNEPPSWSPDGKSIVAIVYTGGGTGAGLVRVNVETGDVTPFGTQDWYNLSGAAWLADGTGLVVTGRDFDATGSDQVWLVSYPGGERRKITNDLNHYNGVTITADAKTIATIQWNRSAAIHLAPAVGATDSQKLSSASSAQQTIDGAVIAPNGSVIYAARAGDSLDLWICDPDGRNPRRLTSDAEDNFLPIVSQDGNFIIFTSTRNGGVPHVWKIDIDGSRPTQLTKGSGEVASELSPDGTWFLYATLSGEPAVWKASVAGGAPVKIASRHVRHSGISPDGKHLFYDFWQTTNNRMRRAVAIAPATGGQSIRTFDWPEGYWLRWSPDGKFLTYVLVRDGAANLWRLPVAGGEPSQLTAFKEGRIFAYDWSPDGKQIVLVSGEVTRDVVLISDFN